MSDANDPIEPNDDTLKLPPPAQPAPAPATPLANPPPDDPGREAREAMDRLSDNNRILLEARMLPRSRPLTKEEIDSVRERLRDYLPDHGIKPAQASRELNYSAPVISQFLSGTYRGNLHKVAHAVNDWMERHARREKAARPAGYVKTWIAETMRTIAHQADKQNLMAAIVVPAGAGKTMVLKALADELRGVYVYCDPSLTERELTYKIAQELGWKQRIGAKVAMRQHIIEELKGTRRAILLDEAQQLNRAIGAVRAIYDQAEVPIIMAGTAEIMRYIDDRADGRGQFSRRTIRFNVIDNLRTVEGPGGARGGAGRDLFTIEEIKTFFASRQIRLTTDGLHLMWLLACMVNHGTLGLVEKLAGIALDLNRDAKALGADHVMEALELFRGPTEADYLIKTVKRYEAIAKAG